MINTDFEDVFNGLMISDAGLRRKNSNQNATFFLTSVKKEFLEDARKWFIDEGFFVNEIKPHSPGTKMKQLGYGDALRFTTKTNTYFTKAYDRWYKNGKKIVDKNIQLRPRMLAYWLMGDGANTEDGKKGIDGNKNSRKITLSTEGFTHNDQIFLKNKLGEIGISARIERSRKNYRIVISQAKNVIHFIELVQHYVLPIYSYKCEKPHLERTSFKRLKTAELKQQLKGKTKNEQKQILNKLKNKRRRERYREDPTLAQKAKNNAKIQYQKKKNKITGSKLGESN